MLLIRHESTNADSGAFFSSSLIPPGFLNDLDVEIPVTLQYFQGAIRFFSGVEHCEGAASEKLFEVALVGTAEFGNLLLSQKIQGSAGTDDRIQDNRFLAERKELGFRN